MKIVRYKCEVITPMFLNGADGASPELRPPSIKGGLRFWFRATHAHLSLKDMKEQEGKLFGDTGRRSKVLIRVNHEGPPSCDKFALLPHREGKRRAETSAIMPGEQFTVVLKFPENVSEQVKALFELFSVLGGLGKRVRRGMGSFRIVSVDERPYHFKIELDHIMKILKLAAPGASFEKGKQLIATLSNGNEAQYPWIKQIQMGSRADHYAQDITVKVGKTTSMMKKKNGDMYKEALGHADGGNRFASPIYVSIVHNEGLFYPVITTLNTVPDSENQNEIQETFRKTILQ